MRSQPELVQILAMGGGLDLKAASIPVERLAQLASAAAESGALLILREMDSRPTYELTHIAAKGAGKVIFVFSEGGGGNWNASHDTNERLDPFR